MSAGTLPDEVRPRVSVKSGIRHIRAATACKCHSQVVDILTLIDEHSRVCLALKVARRINNLGMIEALADAMCLHGNRTTWHLALNDYHSERRLMHRITIGGGPLA